MDQRHLCETVLFFLKTKATSGYGVLLKHIFLLSRLVKLTARLNHSVY